MNKQRTTSGCPCVIKAKQGMKKKIDHVLHLTGFSNSADSIKRKVLAVNS
jgi:hypothetical protein